MKSVQEMRIDEFSRPELRERESQAISHELTSQIQESQDRVNFMNDSREFQDAESTCSGKLTQSTGRCSKSWWYAEPRQEVAT